MERQHKVRLFCSDLDGTLLGESVSTLALAEKWRASAGDTILAYCTGRLHEDAMRMIRQEGMPEPHFYISGVGTMVFDVSAGGMMDGFSDLLNEGWELEKARGIVAACEGISEQAPEQQHAWKSSWFWHDRTPEEIEGLRKKLSAAGLSAQVIYSSARDLDILPLNADKGNAITWLCGKLDIPLTDIVVAGDTGNDSSMFLLPGVRGIVPENAEPELLAVLGDSRVFCGKGFAAAGVIQGLQHYGILSL